MKTARYLIPLFLFFIGCSLQSIAQVDTAYIKAYEHPLSIRIYPQFKILNLQYEYGDNDDDEVDFLSNSPGGIGFGIGWNKTSISGSISIAPLRNKRKGKTKAFDFQYHYYGQKFVADILIQRYQGLYNNDKPIVIYPDLKVTRYGVVWNYIFNNKKFSYSAAFSNTEIQRRSAGSFHLGGMVLHTKIKADSVFSFKSDYNQKNTQIGVSGGYAYTWVIKRNYYITGSLTIGLNVGIDDISGLHRGKVDVYPSYYPRIAAGYNARNWTLSVAATTLGSNLFQSNDNNLNLMSVDVQLTFVRRFNMQSKFLDKVTRQKK